MSLTDTVLSCFPCRLMCACGVTIRILESKASGTSTWKNLEGFLNFCVGFVTLNSKWCQEMAFCKYLRNDAYYNGNTSIQKLLKGPNFLQSMFYSFFWKLIDNSEQRDVCVACTFTFIIFALKYSD